MLSKLRLIGLVGVAGLVLALAFVVRANGSLREDKGALEQQLRQASAANAKNVATIDELVERINKMVDQQRVDEAANAAVVDALTADMERLRATPRIVREEIYRDPSCEQLGAIDIAAACPALASGLRELARRVDGSRGP